MEMHPFRILQESIEHDYKDLKVWDFQQMEN